MNTTQKMMSRMTMPISVPPHLHRPLPAPLERKLEKLAVQERSSPDFLLLLLLAETSQGWVKIIEYALFGHDGDAVHYGRIVPQVATGRKRKLVDC